MSVLRDLEVACGQLFDFRISRSVVRGIERGGLDSPSAPGTAERTRVRTSLEYRATKSLGKMAIVAHVDPMSDLRRASSGPADGQAIGHDL